jgi:hypothetical protein
VLYEIGITDLEGTSPRLGIRNEQPRKLLMEGRMPGVKIFGVSLGDFLKGIVYAPGGVTFLPLVPDRPAD